MKENNLPKTYQVTELITYIYSVILLAYAIYRQFFYVDGTWIHGFAVNGFAILSGLIWMGILFVFKRFLNRILNYSKLNLLINLYLIFLGISILAIANVLYKSVQVYASLEEGDTFKSLTSFATSSISGAIFLFIASFAILLISILLGIQIRKIDLVQKKLFQILGYSFIAYAVISLIETFGLLGTDVLQFFIKISLSTVIGLIIKKVSSMNYSDLNNLSNFENRSKTPTPKLKVEQKKEYKKPKITSTKRNKVIKRNTEKNYSQSEALPTVNIEELENKDLVLSYFKNLPNGELNRLENIVKNKYNQNLTDEQKHILVLHYIAEKKLYDHQRFLPK